MKKLLLSVFALAAVVLSANAAGPTNNATGTAKAELKKNLTVSATDGIDGFAGQQVANGILNFGTIGIGTTGNSVIKITPASASCRSVLSGDAALYSTGETPTAAAFKVTGTNAATYTIGFGATSISLTSAGTPAAPALTVNNFVTNVGATGTNSALGVSYFAVGADLTIPNSATAASDYQGTFNVIVQYN